MAQGKNRNFGAYDPGIPNYWDNPWQNAMGEEMWSKYFGPDGTGKESVAYRNTTPVEAGGKTFGM